MADNFIGLAQESDRNLSIVEDAIVRLNELAAQRAPLNNQCEEVAGLILPSYRGTFEFMSMPQAYDKKTDQQIDSHGQVALGRFMAICDSLLTPQNMKWHGLGYEADDEYVMKDRATRMWFYKVTSILFRLRYSTVSNFIAQNQSIWTELGAFGNGHLFIDQFYDLQNHRKAFRYKAIPLGEIYMEHNHQGLDDGFIRIMRMTARQALKEKRWKDKLSQIDMIKSAAEKGSQRLFTFLHRVCPRDDYNPMRIDFKGKPYASYYIFMEGKVLLSEGGYDSFPIASAYYQKAPNEMAGRGIAHDVLPALKTLNAEKKVFLKAGHRAADPILLIADDGLANLNMRPGSQNKGGMSADGKRLVDTLPSGDIQISKEMMADEVGLIDDAFFVSLFRLAEKQNITATQAIEIINEKGILIAPSLGRQGPNYLGRMIDREITLANEMRMLPPMPPRLKEAEGSYKVIYTSPLAQAMRAQEAAGFFRTVEGVKELVNITGDQSLLDPFSFDRAVPDIATEIQGVPEPWMATVQEMAAKRDARAKAAQVDAEIKAAPAKAAVIKAQAVAMKSGGLAPARRDISQGSPIV